MMLVVVGVALLAAACAVPSAKANERQPLRWGPAPIHHNDVSYGPEKEHVADIHLPVRGGNRGVIILVHGGGFTAGHRNEIVDQSGLVMRQTHRGFTIMNISLRLTDGRSNLFPTAVRDVDQAVSWVRSNGRAHGLNPHTVIVAGGSSGGTLAALVGVGHNSNPNDPLGRTAKIDGWVSFAGIMDFADTGVGHYGETWVGTSNPSDPSRRAASPLNHLDRADPPGYVIHGDHDNVVPLSQMHAVMQRASQLGIGQRLYHDTVTAGVDRGTGLSCRWHLPQCGANSSTFDYWVDRVAERAL